MFDSRRSKRNSDDQKSSTRSRSDSIPSTSKRKPSKKSDPYGDGGFNPISTSFSSTSQSPYPGIAAPSIASSYATANTTDPSNLPYKPPDLVRNESMMDQRPVPNSDTGRESRKKRDSERRREKGSDSDNTKESRRSKRSDKDERRRSSKRDEKPKRTDSDRALENHRASMVENQFPGEFPSTFAEPYRPPGLAADYYGDHGESVAFQPGVRPAQPSIIIAADQAHLHEATVEPAPPPEPSSLGQVGAAASFYGGTSDFESDLATRPPKIGSRPSLRPSRPSTGGQSPRTSPGPEGRPVSVPYSATGIGPAAMAAVGVGAAGSVGQAAEYFSSQFNPDLTEGDSTAAASGYVAGQGMQRPTQGMQYPNQGVQDRPPGTVGPPVTAQGPPSSSNLPIYGAAAAGIAALGAGAYYAGHHTSEEHHSMINPAAGSYGPQYAGQFPSTTQNYPLQAPMQQRRRRTGPLSKILDFFQDPAAVAEYEAYSEAIGVCKDCFDPGSSPRDAPRKHHYNRRNSDGRYGSSTRVDKLNRYQSSEDEKRKRSNGKKWVATGVAAYGLAKMSEAAANRRNGFDDTYSVKSGRPEGSSRVSFAADEQVSRSRRGKYSSVDNQSNSRQNSRREDETIIRKSRKSGELYEERISRRRDSSASDKFSRGAAISSGIAAVGLAAAASHQSKSNSPKKPYYSKRVSPNHSFVDLSATNSGSVGFGSFFSSPSANHRRGKKSKGLGFFNFTNASSSSSDADLAFGAGSVRRKKKGRIDDRKGGDSGRVNAEILGLAATGVDLAAEGDRLDRKGKRRADLMVVKESRNDGSKRHGKKRVQDAPSGSDEGNDDWIDASDDESSVDSALAYGGGLSVRQSRESLVSNNGTDKWAWRWNNGKKQRKTSSQDLSRIRPAVAGFAGAAIAEAATSPGQFRPAESTASLPSMQQLDPVPISDMNGLYDDRRISAISPRTEIPPRILSANTNPAPLQHPQPFAPISQEIYSSPNRPPMYSQYPPQGLMTESPKQLPVGFESQRPRPDESRRRRRNSSPTPSQTQDNEFVRSSRRRASTRDGVKFDLTEAQTEKDRRAQSREQRRSKREDRVDEKQTDSPNFQQEASLECEKDEISRSRHSSTDARTEREKEIERELERLYEEDRRQREARESKRADTWPAAVGTGAGILALAAAQSTSAEDQSRADREERRSRRKSALKQTKTSKTVDDDRSDSQQRRIAQMAATKVKSTSTPIHEDYASYFIPPELAENLQEHNIAAENLDDTTEEPAQIVEVAPRATRRKDTFDPFLYRPFGVEPEDDPRRHPWPVPLLDITEPTPPVSVRGDMSPLPSKSPEPPTVPEVLPEKRQKRSSSVTWGEHRTHEYEVITPMEDHEEFVRATTYEPSQQAADLAEGTHSDVKPELSDPVAVSVCTNGVPHTSAEKGVSGPAAVIEEPQPQANYGQDLEFAAVLAAGAEGAGFDPSIVVDDPTYHRRDSPPGSESASFYRSPFAETVPDLGVFHDVPLQRGFVEGEIPPTPAEEFSKEVLEAEHVKEPRAITQDEPINVEPKVPGGFDVFDYLDDSIAVAPKSVNAVAEAIESPMATNFGKENEKGQDDKDKSSEIYAPTIESVKSQCTDSEPSRKPRRSSTLDEVSFEALPEEPGPQVSYASDPEGFDKKRRSKKSSRTVDRPGEAVIAAAAAATAPTINELLNSERRRRKLQRQDDDYYESVPPVSASDPGANASVGSKKSRRKSKRDSDIWDDTQSIASSPGELRDDLESSKKLKKKSRRDRASFDDGTMSVSSLPAELNGAKAYSRKSKEKPRGIWGLFSSSRPEASISQERSSGDMDLQSRNGRDTKSEDLEEPKRKSKRKLKEKDLNDASSNLQHSRSDLEPSGNDDVRQQSPEDEFISSEEVVRNDERNEDGASFLGERPEMPTVRDGASGPIPETQIAQQGVFAPHIHNALPDSLSSLMRSPPVSPRTTPAKVDERDVTSDEAVSPSTKRDQFRQRHLAEIRTNDIFSSSQAASSPTAVPLHFRLLPISPDFGRSASVGSTSGSPMSPLVTPRTRQGRPISTEFRNSKEYRPLYLVERHSSTKHPEPEVEETYPSLPSSRTSSAHPSMENLRGDDRSELLPQQEISPSQMRDRRHSFSYWCRERPPSPDYLDSKTVTPTATEFPKEVKREKPKYEFHSPSELLEDPSRQLAELEEYQSPPLSPMALPSSVAKDDSGACDSRSLSPARDHKPADHKDLGNIVGLGLVGSAAAALVASQLVKHREPAAELAEETLSTQSISWDLSHPSATTASPLDETAPPLDETAPPLDETTPPLDETAPPLDETAPPLDETAPPLDETTPPSDETAPPLDETAPPLNETVPPLDKTATSLDLLILRKTELSVAPEAAGNEFALKTVSEPLDGREEPENVAYTGTISGAEQLPASEVIGQDFSPEFTASGVSFPSPPELDGHDVQTPTSTNGGEAEDPNILATSHVNDKALLELKRESEVPVSTGEMNENVALDETPQKPKDEASTTEISKEGEETKTKQENFTTESPMAESEVAAPSLQNTEPSPQGSSIDKSSSVGDMNLTTTDTIFLSKERIGNQVPSDNEAKPAVSTELVQQDCALSLDSTLGALDGIDRTAGLEEKTSRNISPFEETVVAPTVDTAALSQPSALEEAFAKAEAARGTAPEVSEEEAFEAFRPRAALEPLLGYGRLDTIVEASREGSKADLTQSEETVKTVSEDQGIPSTAEFKDENEDKKSKKLREAENFTTETENLTRDDVEDPVQEESEITKEPGISIEPIETLVMSDPSINPFGDDYVPPREIGIENISPEGSRELDKASTAKPQGASAAATLVGSPGQTGSAPKDLYEPTEEFSWAPTSKKDRKSAKKGRTPALISDASTPVTEMSSTESVDQPEVEQLSTENFVVSTKKSKKVKRESKVPDWMADDSTSKRQEVPEKAPDPLEEVTQIDQGPAKDDRADNFSAPRGKRSKKNKKRPAIDITDEATTLLTEESIDTIAENERDAPTVGAEIEDLNRGATGKPKKTKKVKKSALLDETPRQIDVPPDLEPIYAPGATEQQVPALHDGPQLSVSRGPEEATLPTNEPSMAAGLEGASLPQNNISLLQNEATISQAEVSMPLDEVTLPQPDQTSSEPIKVSQLSAPELYEQQVPEPVNVRDVSGLQDTYAVPESSEVPLQVSEPVEAITPASIPCGNGEAVTVQHRAEEPKACDILRQTPEASEDLQSSTLRESHWASVFEELKQRKVSEPTPEDYQLGLLPNITHERQFSVPVSEDQEQRSISDQKQLQHVSAVAEEAPLRGDSDCEQIVKQTQEEALEQLPPSQATPLTESLQVHEQAHQTILEEPVGQMVSPPTLAVVHDQTGDPDEQADQATQDSAMGFLSQAESEQQGAVSSDDRDVPEGNLELDSHEVAQPENTVQIERPKEAETTVDFSQTSIQVAEHEVVEQQATTQHAAEEQVIEPEVVKRQIVEPQVVEQDAVQPQVAKHEVVEQQAITQHAAEEQVIEPEVVGPQIVEPQVVEHDSVQPQVAEHKVVEQLGEQEVTEQQIAEQHVNEVSWTSGESEKKDENSSNRHPMFDEFAESSSDLRHSKDIIPVSIVAGTAIQAETENPPPAASAEETSTEADTSSLGSAKKIKNDKKRKKKKSLAFTDETSTPANNYPSESQSSIPWPASLAHLSPDSGLGNPLSEDTQVAKYVHTQDEIQSQLANTSVLPGEVEGTSLTALTQQQPVLAEDEPVKEYPELDVALKTGNRAFVPETETMQEEPDEYLQAIKPKRKSKRENPLDLAETLNTEPAEKDERALSTKKGKKSNKKKKNTFDDFAEPKSEEDLRTTRDMGQEIEPEIGQRAAEQDQVDMLTTPMAEKEPDDQAVRHSTPGSAKVEDIISAIDDKAVFSVPENDAITGHLEEQPMAARELALGEGGMLEPMPTLATEEGLSGAPAQKQSKEGKKSKKKSKSAIVLQDLLEDSSSPANTSELGKTEIAQEQDHGILVEYGSADGPDHAAEPQAITETNTAVEPERTAEQDMSLETEAIEERDRPLILGGVEPEAATTEDDVWVSTAEKSQKGTKTKREPLVGTEDATAETIGTTAVAAVAAAGHHMQGDTEQSQAKERALAEVMEADTAPILSSEPPGPPENAQDADPVGEPEEDTWGFSTKTIKEKKKKKKRQPTSYGYSSTPSALATPSEHAQPSEDIANSLNDLAQGLQSEQVEGYEAAEPPLTATLAPIAKIVEDDSATISKKKSKKEKKKKKTLISQSEENDNSTSQPTETSTPANELESGTLEGKVTAVDRAKEAKPMSDVMSVDIGLPQLLEPGVLSESNLQTTHQQFNAIETSIDDPTYADAPYLASGGDAVDAEEDGLWGFSTTKKSMKMKRKKAEVEATLSATENGRREFNPQDEAQNHSSSIPEVFGGRAESELRSSQLPELANVKEEQRSPLVTGLSEMIKEPEVMDQPKMTEESETIKESEMTKIPEMVIGVVDTVDTAEIIAKSSSKKIEGENGRQSSYHGSNDTYSTEVISEQALPKGDPRYRGRPDNTSSGAANVISQTTAWKATDDETLPNEDEPLSQHEAQQYGVQDQAIHKHDEQHENALLGSDHRREMPRPLQTTWSFANLKQDTIQEHENRDSGIQVSNSPLIQVGHLQFTLRDSGYAPSPIVTPSCEGSPRDKDARSALTRPPRPISPTSSFEDLRQKSHDYSMQYQQPDSTREMDDPPLHPSDRHSFHHDQPEVLPRGHPSPVDPTSKDRSSALFNSSPSNRTDVYDGTPGLDTRHILAPSTGLHRSPSIHGHRSRENFRALSPSPSPNRHLRQISDAPITESMQETSQQPHRSIFGPFAREDEHERGLSPPRTPLRTIHEHVPDTSPSNHRGRPLSDVGSPDRGHKSIQISNATALGGLTDRPNAEHTGSALKAQAPPIHSSAVESEQQTENAVPENHSRTLPEVGGLVGVAAAAGAAAITAEELRPTSRDDKTGDTKSLGKSKSRSTSSKQLRRSQASFENVASSSTHDPVREKGKAAARDMADVYNGYGEFPGAPISPTRPPSVRKRQSMQQIKDLEARLDQLASENRLLATAKVNAEQELQELHFAQSRTEHATQEALELRDAELREKDEAITKMREALASMQKEVARLTEVNEGLKATHDELRSTHEQRYSQLEQEHAETHEQWQESSRELEDLKSKHTELSTGMEEIVRRELDTRLAEKDAEIRRLHDDLEDAKTKIRELQQQILAGQSDEIIITRDEDYFDNACQQLCQHVQQWVLRFSKFSDTRVCRLTNQVRDEKVIDRFDNAILDGSDVDIYLGDRVRRRDVFMSVVMTMIWEYIFTRYLFGMDREQRQKLKLLEKNLSEVGPQSAVHRWRAMTLTILSKRESFKLQRASDTEAVVQEIYSTLARFLPPPQHLQGQIQESLRNVMKTAVDLSVEMRTQRAEYIMLPPLQPEYDTNGDLARKVYFNAALMNERSGETTSNDELEAQQAVVRMVLFPLVVKKGSDTGEGDEEIVVCPAQVLVARSGKDKTVVKAVSGDRMSVDQANRSVQSFTPSALDPTNVI